MGTLLRISNVGASDKLIYPCIRKFYLFTCRTEVLASDPPKSLYCERSGSMESVVLPSWQPRNPLRQTIF
jgi:hypothetical protein